MLVTRPSHTYGKVEQTIIFMCLRLPLETSSRLQQIFKQRSNMGSRSIFYGKRSILHSAVQVEMTSCLLRYILLFALKTNHKNQIKF